MIALEHGLAEALHYMRRPIATIAGHNGPDVLARSAPAEVVVSDNPALCEAWLHYPDRDLVVGTLTNGSPLLKYLSAPQTWLRFAAMHATGVLRPDALGDGERQVPEVPAGALQIDGKKHAATVHWSPPDLVTRMVVAPATSHRMSEAIVITVTGTVDAVDEVRLRLVVPDRRIASAVFFGPYPKFEQWQALERSSAGV